MNLERPESLSAVMGMTEKEVDEIFNRTFGIVLTSDDDVESIREVFPEFENNKEMLVRIFAYWRARQTVEYSLIGKSQVEKLQNAHKGILSEL